MSPSASGTVSVSYASLRSMPISAPVGGSHSISVPRRTYAVECPALA